MPHPDVFKLVRNARITVTPSRCEEAAGNVALEAMAHGTPIVAYAMGGLREYVTDAGAGRVIPPDVETLVRTCAELHGDEETWVEMSKRGRAAVASAHSADAYARRLVTMYEAATNRPASTRER